MRNEARRFHDLRDSMTSVSEVAPAPPAERSEIKSPAFRLHPAIESDLRALQQALVSDGALRSAQQLQTFYDTVRRRFGPEVLRSLDGLPLLELMHAHGNRDS